MGEGKTDKKVVYKTIKVMVVFTLTTFCVSAWTVNLPSASLNLCQFSSPGGSRCPSCVFNGTAHLYVIQT